MATRGKRQGGPWYGEFRRLIAFESGMVGAHPSLKRAKLKGGGVQYLLDLEVPHYAGRSVTLRFLRRNPSVPIILVDGPTDSPHRYGESGRTSLCVWYPGDPRSKRWEVEDGLDHLIVLVQLHLFKEAWWRETGEWLGQEVHPAKKRKAS